MIQYHKFPDKVNTFSVFFSTFLCILQVYHLNNVMRKIDVLKLQLWDNLQENFLQMQL